MVNRADVIDLSTSSPPPSTSSRPKERRVEKCWTLYPHRFWFPPGGWMTMTEEKARELCENNGGLLLSAAPTGPTKSTPKGRFDYVVLGARNYDKEGGKYSKVARIMSEKHLLNIILEPSCSDKQTFLPFEYKDSIKDAASSTAGSKRSAPSEFESQPAKCIKCSKRDSEAEESPMETSALDDFLLDGEIEMKRRTILAADCGGTITKIQRCKSAVDMIKKMNDFFVRCDGDYHKFL